MHKTWYMIVYVNKVSGEKTNVKVYAETKIDAGRLGIKKVTKNVGIEEIYGPIV